MDWGLVLMIFFLIHISVISFTLSPAILYCALETNIVANRWFYLTVSVWSGFFMTAMSVTSELVVEISCWKYLLSIFVAPALVVLPYFLMTLEYWVSEKKDRDNRKFILRLLERWNRKGEIRSSTSIKIVSVFVLIEFVAASICLGLRVLGGGFAQLSEECSLYGAELIFLAVNFGCYLCLSFFGIYLQFDCKAGRYLLLKEQNLMSIWSILTLGTYLVLAFSPVLMNGFEEGLFKPQLLLLLFNLGPVLFSLIPTSLAFLSSKIIRSKQMIRMEPSDTIFSLFMLRRSDGYVTIPGGEIGLDDHSDPDDDAQMVIFDHDEDAGVGFPTGVPKSKSPPRKGEKRVDFRAPPREDPSEDLAADPLLRKD